MNLVQQSATQLASMIRSKEISSKETVIAYLQQIEKVNPKINAVIFSRAEKALAEAAILDKKMLRDGVQGPLHGVPFTVKDMISTQDDLLTYGTLGLKNNFAKEDATLIQRLRAAGAILLGKTNMPEFANAADTDNLLFGKTLNPYDLQRSAGGSSGGGAAIVATCGAAFDMGSDAGGSLRLPAHYCGITAIRPTIGRVPGTGCAMSGQRNGLVGLFAADGPLARSVDDLELILSVISGTDYIDPKVVDMPLNKLDVTDIRQLRIAYFTENNHVAITPETQQAVDNVVRVLTAAGAAVNENFPAILNQGFDLFHGIIGSFGAAAYENLLHRFHTETPSPSLLKALAMFRQKTSDIGVFLQRWTKWDQYRSELLQFMQQHDVIICPVTASPAIDCQRSLWDADLFPEISYCWMFSLTNFPVVSVRAGTSKEGLPIGVQVIAKPWHEHVALAVARCIESELGGWQMPVMAQ